MPQEFIEIYAAHDEIILRMYPLTIPKRKITIFTGVSGSGKSSIVFDTIAAEAQRLLKRTSACLSAIFYQDTRNPKRMRSKT